MKKLISAPAPAQPSRKRSANPRRPSQERGARRFTALLDATEKLLETNHPDDIGHYQIAEAAGVSAASVYHFFPTRHAALRALADRTVEALNAAVSQPISARALTSWQVLCRIEQLRTLELYAARPIFLKILYGGHGGLQAWRSEPNSSVADAAAQFVRRAHSAFHLENSKDMELRAGIFLSLRDAIWEFSYQRHGFVTEDFANEALETTILYMSQYWPVRASVREQVREAALKDEILTLPLKAA